MASKISRNRFLATLALLLGAIAIFGDPYHSSADVEPLATEQIVWLNSVDLAQQVLEGRTDLRILDLRDAEAFGDYHLLRAERVAVDELKDHDFGTWDRIVVYGAPNEVAQGLAVLEDRQVKGAMALRGGIAAWQDEILNPVLAEGSTPEQIEQFRVLRGISLQLGGKPIGGGDLLAEQMAKPRPKLELPSAASLPTGRKKKASEGC